MGRFVALLFFTILALASRELIAGEKISLWSNADGPHLRGANIYQRRVFVILDGPTFMGPGPVGPPFAQTDFDRLSAMGANVVVLSHPGIFTEKPPYVLDPDMKRNLDRLLAMVLKADMFAIIAFRTGPGRSDFTMVADEVGDWFDASYLNDHVWNDTAAQAGWVAMWQATAGYYGSHPAVVGYHLMVEPNSNELGSDAVHDRLDEWDPEVFQEKYGGTMYDWNQLYPRITKAIRVADPDTPILIGGNGYSGLQWLPFVEPSGDGRTVYTTHQYDPHDYTHQEPGDRIAYPGRIDIDGDGVEDTFDRGGLTVFFKTLDSLAKKWNAPLAVTEFGVQRWAPGAARFMSDQMELFEKRGINYMLWEWASSHREFEKEVNAFNFRFGPIPGHLSNVASSPLANVIRRFWARNKKRPSNTRF